MKLALSLLVWTLIALTALYVLGPDTSRDLPKPKPPPSQPAQHALAPFTGMFAPASPAQARRATAWPAFRWKMSARRVHKDAVA